MQDQQPEPEQLPHLTIPRATVFYVAVFALACLWSAFTEPGLDLLLRAPKALAVPWWAGGALAGLGLVALTMLAEPIFPALRRLSEQLAPLVAPFHTSRILTFALLSGICEEALFRGPMQHGLGYVLASLIFALLHGGTSRRFIAWSTFALLAGLCFGLLAEIYGSFWPAALAHVVVNGINLRRLAPVWSRLADKEQQ